MIAVQLNLQTFLNYTLVLLALVAGLVAGMLAGRFVHLTFGVEGSYLAEPASQPMTVRQPQEEDLQVILQRSLFNAEAVGATLERVDLSASPFESEPDPAATSLDNFILMGTVVAADYSLALIQSGNKLEVYGLGSELASGVTIESIERKLVVVSVRGNRQELHLVEQQSADAPRTAGSGAPRSAAARSAATPATQSGVVDMGEGRFRVDRALVDNARSNMGALLQSARMIPQMENGQTQGFRLVGMQRGSLLEQLGLRLGDVVVEINRIKLDSPEKALQVFQQVREANNISVGLVRDGQPQTFEYSFE
ncbi:MAG: type II secretion system protein GspC [Pelovirga sp.]